MDIKDAHKVIENLQTRPYICSENTIELDNGYVIAKKEYFKECQAAEERQRAKKPEFVRVADKNKNQYLCPYCKTGMYHYSDEERKWMNNRFCPKCGQAIDWSDTD